MGKDKLKKFAENKTFRCLVQPEFDEIFGKDHPLKGRWHADFFRNDRPIVLELGCGKGEYTVALAADVTLIYASKRLPSLTLYLFTPAAIIL